MKTQTYQTKEEWLLARKGKITGSRLKDIVVKRGTGKKIGFYELIAERLGLPADGENPMDRGTRLEEEAISKFTEITGKKVNTDLVIWTSDVDDSIAISPDGYMDDYEEAVEIKCLGSARHIEAYLTQEIPDDYEFQVLQYFIVNEKLETLYFGFYDPRIPAIPFFYITVNRADIEADIETYLNYQKNTIAEVDDIVLKLSGF
jgi:putative phage-type endonuclease